MHNPTGFIDRFGVACCPSINTWNDFQSRSKGQFSSRTEAAKAYQLWKNKDWAALEKMMPPGAWPPNGGFVSITRTTLQPGMQVDRYGGRMVNSVFNDTGTYVAQAGVPFEVRALPVGDINRPYTVYEVVKPLPADMGPAIPWFGQPGMGTQYKFTDGIDDLIAQGYLKRLPWFIK
ncbi:TNT domain-containing protein [Providencia stuartii]|nr:TNT domain-containing protein [Providencia stuartii]MDN0012390.1 TNT domain-containing protein [Providencia stuartii]